MSEIRRFLSRLWQTFRPTPTDANTEREIAAHLTLLEDEYRRQGLSQPEARVAARRALGGAEQARALARDAGRLPSIDNLRRDVGYGLRTLARSPGFAIVTVLTLALGIGGTTSIFSLAYSVLVRPLPFPDAHRIVALQEGVSGN